MKMAHSWVHGLLVLAACGGSSGKAVDAALDGATQGGDGGVLADRALDGTPGAPDAAADGRLRVEGNHFVRGGQPFRMLGVNHSGAEFACAQGNGIFDGPSDDTLGAAIATWHANTVRVPLNEDCWLGINGVKTQYAGATYQQAIHDFVAMLKRHNMVVIMDLHWNAPGTTLALHQQPMVDADHGLDFWRSVATSFKDAPDVVFDLYNEPYVDTSNAATSDPWACWLHGCTITQGQSVTGSFQSVGAQDLIDAVRGTGATNVLMMGGLAWANDLTGWVAHEPSDPLHQLAASFHLYNFNSCKDATCWNAQIAPVAAAVPLVTGELGENDCAHGFIDTYMAWADSKAISYLGWTFNTWDCSSGPALITDYTGTATGFGAGLKAHLLTQVP